MAGRVAGAGALVMACLSGAATSAHADEITYGYDALGRLTSVAVAGDTAYYDYDAAGNITAIRRQAAVSSAAGDAASLLLCRLTPTRLFPRLRRLISPR